MVFLSIKAHPTMAKGLGTAYMSQLDSSNPRVTALWHLNLVSDEASEFWSPIVRSRKGFDLQSGVFSIRTSLKNGGRHLLVELQGFAGSAGDRGRLVRVFTICTSPP